MFLTHLLLIFFVSFAFCKEVEFTDCLPKGDVKGYTVHNVFVTPDEIKAGDTMVVDANGTVIVPVTGGEVDVDVSMSGTPLLHYTYDLCTVIDCGCPTVKGDHPVTFKHEIPQFILPGWYDLVTTVYDQDKAEISCTAFKLQLVG